MSLQAKIIELTKDVTQFLDNEKQYSSSQFLRFISALKKIGTVNEHLDDEEEHKQNSSEYEFMWKQVEQPQD